MTADATKAYITIGRIHEIVGLSKGYVYGLSSQGKLPEPDDHCRCERHEPLWLRSTIERWRKGEA